MASRKSGIHESAGPPCDDQRMLKSPFHIDEVLRAMHLQEGETENPIDEGQKDEGGLACCGLCRSLVPLRRRGLCSDWRECVALVMLIGASIAGQRSKTDPASDFSCGR